MLHNKETFSALDLGSWCLIRRLCPCAGCPTQRRSRGDLLLQVLALICMRADADDISFLNCSWDAVLLLINLVKNK